jgi:hypothetical protein
MARLFDLPAEWGTRLADMTEAASSGGHFIVDQFPQHRLYTALGGFLVGATSGQSRHTRRLGE